MHGDEGTAKSIEPWKRKAGKTAALLFPIFPCKPRAAPLSRKIQLSKNYANRRERNRACVQRISVANDSKYLA